MILSPLPLFLIIFSTFPRSDSVFLDVSSISVRNARWLSENDLTWYHSYVPDLVKMLAAGVNEEDDDHKPGYDPGTLEQLDLNLRGLCHKANTTLMSMNLSRECAVDLRFLVCSGAYLTIALERMSTGHCQKQSTPGQTCQRLLKEQIQTNLWTSKYLDSFGKVSGGWLSGNYMHFGSYQQCTQLNVKRPKSSNQPGEFNGKFCYATFSLPLSATRSALASSCYGRNFTQACAPITNSYVIKWGFCVPKSCSIREVNGLALFSLYTSNVTVCPARPLVLCVEEHSLASDTPAIIMTTICCILAAIIITSTIYDLVQRKHITREWLDCCGTSQKSHRREPQNTITSNSFQPMETENRSRYADVFRAFSIYTNLESLWEPEDYKRTSTRCLDGIRVLTMAWIILAQSVLLLIDYVGNLMDYVKLPSILAFQAINNSSFSTDTFFFISGFLNAVAWLKTNSNRDENRPIVKTALFGILKRLIRVLPVYVFILIVAISFWGHLGEGPMWLTATFSHSGPLYCKYTWWTNLLFINNFVYLDYACMPWTWHIAAEMQLYILAVPILILYKKRPLAGFLVSAVLVLLSMVLNGIVVGSYELAPSLMASTNISRFDSINSYYHKIYVKPYMRWNPYLIGIFFAYVIKRTERNRGAMGLKYLQIRPIKLSAWALVVAVFSILVYSLHGFASGLYLPTAAAVIYAAVSRTLWALVIGILVLLCVRTKGGLIKWFLSWSFWTPLSRLTYPAFLIHAFAIVFFYGTAKEWLTFSFSNMIYFWLSSMIISYCLGFIAFICVEAPVFRISSIFLGGSHTPPVDSFLLDRNTNADTTTPTSR